MTLTERQALHTLRMGRLIVYADAMGVPVKVQEWNRLFSTQKEYVASGVSKTLLSDHLDNCATDVYIVIAGVAVVLTKDSPATDKERYRIIGRYWRELGGQWGGDFCDRAKFIKENGREFDPEKDMGWDPFHMGSPKV